MFWYFWHGNLSFVSDFASATEKSAASNTSRIRISNQVSVDEKIKDKKYGKSWVKLT